MHDALPRHPLDAALNADGSLPAERHYLRDADTWATWAYHDANGKPLRGPCADTECRYMSAPGGGDHDGPHSWQDGTTGWGHDYGQPCSCPDCGGIDHAAL
jgi:hypothetical protein